MEPVFEYRPLPQDLQSLEVVDPASHEYIYLPAGQGVQSDLPVELAYLPGGQLVQMYRVFQLLYFPRGQLVQPEAPDWEDLPGEQLVQNDLPVELA